MILILIICWTVILLGLFSVIIGYKFIVTKQQTEANTPTPKYEGVYIQHTEQIETLVCEARYVIDNPKIVERVKNDMAFQMGKLMNEKGFISFKENKRGEHYHVMETIIKGEVRILRPRN